MYDLSSSCILSFINADRLPRFQRFDIKMPTPPPPLEPPTLRFTSPGPPVSHKTLRYSRRTAHRDLQKWQGLRQTPKQGTVYSLSSAKKLLPKRLGNSLDPWRATGRILITSLLVVKGVQSALDNLQSFPKLPLLDS